MAERIGIPRVVNRTGNAEIDGFLWGWAWDAGDFTFSFPRSAGNYQGYARIGGFQAFNGVQKTAVREILNQIESFCDVTSPRSARAAASPPTASRKPGCSTTRTTLR